MKKVPAIIDLIELKRILEETLGEVERKQ